MSLHKKHSLDVIMSLSYMIYMPSCRYSEIVVCLNLNPLFLIIVSENIFIYNGQAWKFRKLLFGITLSLTEGWLGFISSFLVLKVKWRGKMSSRWCLRNLHNSFHVLTTKKQKTKVNSSKSWGWRNYFVCVVGKR